MVLDKLPYINFNYEREKVWGPKKYYGTPTGTQIICFNDKNGYFLLSEIWILRLKCTILFKLLLDQKYEPY